MSGPGEHRGSVGIDRPPLRCQASTHHRFAEPGRGLDDDAVSPSRYRVRGEQHTCRLGGHHLLDDDGHRDIA